MKKKLTTVISQIIGIGLIGMPHANAGDFNVKSASDTPVAGLLTLREAVQLSNGLPGSFIVM